MMIFVISQQAIAVTLRSHVWSTPARNDNDRQKLRLATLLAAWDVERNNHDIAQVVIQTHYQTYYSLLVSSSSSSLSWLWLIMLVTT